VFLGGKQVGASQQVQIGLSVICRNFLDDVFDSDHSRSVRKKYNKRKLELSRKGAKTQSQVYGRYAVLFFASLRLCGKNSSEQKGDAARWSRHHLELAGLKLRL
jgi:hypothetical protein